LYFAQIFGINETSLRATATAAILPANGFRVNEGSDDTANVMPFAYKKDFWDRFERAQEHYDDNPELNLNDPNLGDIPDPEFPDDPLFGGTDPDNGDFVQLFFDDFTRSDEGAVSAGADGHLEVDIYPRNLKFNSALPEEDTSGNFGTVDFGDSSNSTSDLSRQIREGLNEDDLSHFDNNEIVLSEDDPLDAEGDTGVSGGIKAALEDVKGECKAIALFTSVEGPGNNAVFELVKFVSATVVKVKFSGSNKELRVQRCRLVDDNAIPDEVDDEIDQHDTIFTPLILIR
jgi:hypothetical protein